MKYDVLVKGNVFATYDDAGEAIRIAMTASTVFPKSVCETEVDGEKYTYVLGSRVYM